MLFEFDGRIVGSRPIGWGSIPQKSTTGLHVSERMYGTSRPGMSHQSWASSLMAKHPVCTRKTVGSSPACVHHGPVAPMIEHPVGNREVMGLSPIRSTIYGSVV